MEASVLPGMRSSISLRQVVQIAQLSHALFGWVGLLRPRPVSLST